MDSPDYHTMYSLAGIYDFQQAVTLPKKIRPQEASYSIISRYFTRKDESVVFLKMIIPEKER